MKIAYLVLAHNNPDHLQRLVNALSTDSSRIFIHIDKKTNQSDYEHLVSPNVYLTRDRVPVFWGDFSQVEAILILLKSALSHECKFDRFVLLSGADYPLKSAEKISDFFKKSIQSEYMNLVSMPSDGAGKPISRLTDYKVRQKGTLVNKLLRKALSKIGVSYKRNYKSYLNNLSPYGGCTWWALSRAACEYIVSFCDNEIDIVDFFKNTDCPDEVFFHTIIGNSPFKTNIVRNITYADWSNGRHNPAFLTQEHIENLFSISCFISDRNYGNGEVLFCRKFQNDSEYLIEKINELNQAK